MFVGQGGFVDADKIGGQDALQVPKPVLEPIVLTGGVDGDV